MKNTAIQLALNSIAIHVEMLERETTHADTNWHERYLQEQKDHRDNVNHLNTVVDTRTETMVGWMQSAKSWEDRFNALTHDMDGTMSTLREMKAQLALKTKAADHLGKLYDAMQAKQTINVHTIDKLEEQNQAAESHIKDIEAALDNTFADLRAQEEENARLNAVLAAIQSACKG